MTTNLSPDTAAAKTRDLVDPTRHRVRLLALTLAVTAVAATVGGVFWPEPAGGGETYSYADIADQRILWWGLLMGLAAMAVVNIPMQALAVMLLVRRRASRLATTGGVLMWVGAGLQAVGVAGWAAVYFFATDPSVDAAAGSAVVEAANSDMAHLFGLMIPGAAMVLLGTVIQCVALFRSRAVPRWVPIAVLTIVLTFVIPGSGVLGLLTSLPMAAGSIGLAYYVWKSVS
jgi:hypothetical protein